MKLTRTRIHFIMDASFFIYTRSKMTYDFLYATLNFMYAYSIKDK